MNWSQAMSFISLLQKTLRSITRAKLLALMLLCALLAFLVVVSMAIGITWLTANLVTLNQGWLDTSLSWLAGIVSGIGGWFMLPALVVLVSGAFLEVTIRRVELADYPDKIRQGEPRFWPDIVHDINFTLKAIFLNVLIVPFYFIGIGDSFNQLLIDEPWYWVEVSFIYFSIAQLMLVIIIVNQIHTLEKSIKIQNN